MTVKGAVKIGVQAKQHALQVSTGKHFEELIENTLEGWQRDAFKDSILLRKSLSETKQQVQNISFKIQKYTLFVCW